MHDAVVDQEKIYAESRKDEVHNLHEQVLHPVLLTRLALVLLSYPPDETTQPLQEVASMGST